MARTALTPVTPIGPYPVTLPLAADSADITFTAADTVNLNSAPFGNASSLLILARNTGASARTITINSVADPFNRKGDITTYSIGAGETAAFIVKREGWAQSADASLYLEASNAEVTIAVLRV